jgi:hypothetical protein
LVVSGHVTVPGADSKCCSQTKDFFLLKKLYIEEITDIYYFWSVGMMEHAVN